MDEKIEETEEKEVEETEEKKVDEQPDNLESRLKLLEEENEVLKNQISELNNLVLSTGRSSEPDESKFNKMIKDII